MYLRFHCGDKSRLRCVLGFQGFHNLLVDSAFYDYVLNDHGIRSLTLPPQAGVCLLIQFKAPC